MYHPVDVVQRDAAPSEVSAERRRLSALRLHLARYRSSVVADSPEVRS